MLIWAVVKSIGRAPTELCFALITCIIPAFSAADTQTDPTVPTTSGLLWNRSGLPAVFPLQVKTSPGRDYILTLIDEETKHQALAAYIVGGAFFKVLVPPGAYTLRFSFGDVWQSKEQNFSSGLNSGQFDLEEPQTFKIHGAGTKAGHLVDLTEIQSGELVKAKVKPQFICQGFRTVFFPALELGHANKLRIQNGSGSHNGRRFSEEIRMLGVGPYPRREYRGFFYLRYEVRARYCE
ncbi:hypothetical protein C1J03_18760 [Sulfitobacter sp. SK012]|nr:hypothetical protein [Sulfitobacter sp. SK012]AXI47870.1 hypothetical protein C1J03_18760 [Sulfitobacter sp. SK012]